MTSELLLLKRNPNQALEKLYRNHRRSFLRNLRTYALPHDDAILLYQDAWIALRAHCIDETFTYSKISLRSSLFAIGELLLRERNWVAASDDWSPKKPFDSIPLVQFSELTTAQYDLGKKFKALGLRCQHMLSLFYYRKLTLAEIIYSLGHENEFVVKRQKKRCLLSLQETTVALVPEEHEILFDLYLQHSLSPSQKKQFDTVFTQEKEGIAYFQLITDLQAVAGHFDREDFKMAMAAFEHNYSSKDHKQSVSLYVKKGIVFFILLFIIGVAIWMYQR